MPSNWKHAIIDGIPYFISCTSGEINFEGKDTTSKYMFLKSQQHRGNVARYATDLHRIDCKTKVPENWKVNFDGKKMTIDFDGCLDSKKHLEKEASAADTQQAIIAMEKDLAAKKQQLAQEQQAEAAANKPVPPAPGAVVQQATPEMQAPLVVTQSLKEDKVEPEDNTMNNQIDPTIARALLEQVQQVADEAKKDDTLVNAGLLDMLHKIAGDFPFLKKEDKKDDKGSDKKDEKKPNPFEKKDDKKEDKSEEKKDDKKPAPFKKKDDKKEEPAKEDKKEEPKKEEPKKEEPKKEDKKDDEKPEHKAPKSDEKSDEPEKPSKSEIKEEKRDIKDAEKALAIIEKLLKKEEKEEKDGMEEGSDVAVLQEAIEKIKNFIGKEGKEIGEKPAGDIGLDLGKTDMSSTIPPMGAPKPGADPMKGVVPQMEKIGPAVSVEKPADDIALPLPKEDAGIPEPSRHIGPVTKKLPMMKKQIGEKHDNIPEDLKHDHTPTFKPMAFKINDRVWYKTAGDETYTLGDEPGRIIDNSGDKVVVDWGDDIPTQENPQDLEKALVEDNQENIFENIETKPEEEANLFTDQTAFTAEPVAIPETPEAALAQASFSDMLSKHSSGLDAEGTVYHVSTGLKGTIVSHANDGRYNVKFGDKIATVWPYEISIYSAE